jgi:hypothetical protein
MHPAEAKGLISVLSVSALRRAPAFWHRQEQDEVVSGGGLAYNAKWRWQQGRKALPPSTGWASGFWLGLSAGSPFFMHWGGSILGLAQSAPGEVSLSPQGCSIHAYVTGGPLTLMVRPFVATPCLPCKDFPVYLQRPILKMNNRGVMKKNGFTAKKG